MNNFDIHSLITTVDNLIFSYTGENLDDVQSEILEGVIPENQLQKSNLAEEYKLEIATELMKEGLTFEQIARVLKLPLELVKEQLEKPKQPN
ncbi:MAG: hypothetical protein GPJ15_23515 [Microcystis aeruginosa G11-06]|nr:hypothetical protein [Microcystis aeruginosa G11-06]